MIRAKCLAHCERGGDAEALTRSIVSQDMIDAEDLLLICGALMEEGFLAECDGLARLGADEFPASRQKFARLMRSPDKESTRQMREIIDKGWGY